MNQINENNCGSVKEEERKSHKKVELTGDAFYDLATYGFRKVETASTRFSPSSPCYSIASSEASSATTVLQTPSPPMSPNYVCPTPPPAPTFYREVTERHVYCPINLGHKKHVRFARQEGRRHRQGLRKERPYEPTPPTWRSKFRMDTPRRPTESPTRPTASDYRPTASEHRPTASVTQSQGQALPPQLLAAPIQPVVYYLPRQGDNVLVPMLCWPLVMLPIPNHEGNPPVASNGSHTSSGGV